MPLKSKIITLLSLHTETLDKSGPPRPYDPLLPVKLWFHSELWSLFGISVCFGSLFAIFVLFGLVAPLRYGLSPRFAGSLTALFGLGCFTGSQLGGKGKGKGTSVHFEYVFD